MSKQITRRDFFKKGAVFAVAVNFIPNLINQSSSKVCSMENIDISVVKGTNYFTNTIKAVENLGGIEKFVPSGTKVALLPNVQRNNPGTYTKPEILKAVVKMCKQAGAKEINVLSWLDNKHFENTGLIDVIKNEGINLVLVERNDLNFKSVPVAYGKALKEAKIMKEFFNNDVFITIPVTKDHAGNKFTGTLKNMMGLNSPANNRFFHQKNWTTDKNSIIHLDQCIADLNTVIKPDLCIVDATEFIITNGPFGPGKLLKPNKVIVGTDRVAIDAYCCKLWGLKPEDIVMINKAFEHNLGEINLNKVNIKEIEI